MSCSSRTWDCFKKSIILEKQSSDFYVQPREDIDALWHAFFHRGQLLAYGPPQLLLQSNIMNWRIGNKFGQLHIVHLANDIINKG